MPDYLRSAGLLVLFAIAAGFVFGSRTAYILIAIIFVLVLIAGAQRIFPASWSK